MQVRESLRLRACALALLVCGISHGAAAADTVSLRFAWPHDVALRIERSFERQEIREPGAAPPSTRSTTRFVWTGRRSGSRYRVAFSDFAVVQEEPRPRSVDALVQLEYVSRSVEPILPTLVLDADGQPVDLEGLPELRRQLLARYESVPGVPEDPQVTRMVQVLTSDQMLAQRAIEDWNRMVQIWHGVDAEVGRVREFRDRTGDAAGAPIENVLSYALERRVPCAAGGTELSCIRLVVTQSPRLTDMRSAMRSFLGFDFASALGAPPTAHLEAENTFTTDTDPGSLLPSRYVKEKRWSVRWVDADGKARKVGRIDRWTYVFSRVR